MQSSITTPGRPLMTSSSSEKVYHQKITLAFDDYWDLRHSNNQTHVNLITYDIPYKDSLQATVYNEVGHVIGPPLIGYMPIQYQKIAVRIPRLLPGTILRYSALRGAIHKEFDMYETMLLTCQACNGVEQAWYALLKNILFIRRRSAFRIEYVTTPDSVIFYNYCCAMLDDESGM